MEILEKEHLRRPGASTYARGAGTPSSSATLGLPPNIEQASALWPFAPARLTTAALSAQITAQLPPIERATALIEAYFANLARFLSPIDREQAAGELLPLFYPRSTFDWRRTGSTNSHGNDSSSADQPSIASVALEQPHELALLYAVFACGAVADLTQAPDNSEAARYIALSLAVLGLHNVFDAGSLSACQAVSLNGSFKVHSGRRATQGNSWKMLPFAFCLCSSVGAPFYPLIPLMK